MISSLKYVPPQRYKEKLTETKSGVFIYAGDAYNFHEWHFRSMARYNGTKTEDRFKLGNEILQGLRGDAYMVAKDMGLTALAQQDAVPVLVEKIKKTIFPRQEQEAKELFLHGQRPEGFLVRQHGESMQNYISRRRRWWIQVKELDEKIEIPEKLRIDYLLDFARLKELQKEMVKTRVGADPTFDKTAEMLMEQYGRHHIQEKAGEKTGKKHSKILHKNQKSHGFRRRAYITEGLEDSSGSEFEETRHVRDAAEAEDQSQIFSDDSEPDEPSTVDDGDAGATALLATGDLQDDDAAKQIEIEHIELDVLTAFLTTEEEYEASHPIPEQQAEHIADAAQAETVCQRSPTRRAFC